MKIVKKQNGKHTTNQNWWNQVFGDDWFDFPRFPSAFEDEERYGFLPSVDVSEKDNQFVVEADLPGFNSDNINVEIEDNSLVLSGEVENEKKEENKKKNYFHRERLSGNFYRKFSLPPTADLETADCQFKNGTLTIKIKKKKEAEPKKLKVNVK